MPSTQPDTLEREIRIAAQPETIFAFFVDPAKIMQWLGKAVTADARPGGLCRIDINGYVTRGEYLEIVPPSRVVFTWGWENEGSTPRPASQLSRFRSYQKGRTRWCACATWASAPRSANPMAKAGITSCRGW